MFHCRMATTLADTLESSLGSAAPELETTPVPIMTPQPTIQLLVSELSLFCHTERQERPRQSLNFRFPSTAQVP